MAIFKRKPFSNINRHQKRLLYPVLISCLIGCIITLLFLDYFYFDRSSIINTFAFEHIKVGLLWFLFIISTILFFVAFSIFHVSNKILGPHERILKELDEIIALNEKKFLRARKGDEMFEDIIQRINALIERLP